MEFKIPFTSSSLVFGPQKVLTECQKCGVPTRHKCVKVVGNLSKWRCESCSTVYVSLTAKCSECPNEKLSLLEDRDTWIKFECGMCSSVTYFYIFDCSLCRKSTLHEGIGPIWKCVNCNTQSEMQGKHLAEIIQDIGNRIQSDTVQDALDAKYQN